MFCPGKLRDSRVADDVALERPGSGMKSNSGFCGLLVKLVCPPTIDPALSRSLPVMDAFS
tara:strand:- start:117 stop:296 length:180 start_codon:yes stop_codon:yes gene_type:complete